MTGVSGFELMRAARMAGVGASFPVHNAGSIHDLERWLGQLQDLPGGMRLGALIPNLIVHRTNDQLGDEVDLIAKSGVPAVITSVGSPAGILGPLHDAGVEVYSDVASLRHAHRAIEAGVDGLILLSAGAGGQTGWANPFVFVRAVRAVWDGPIVLAGGVTDGSALYAAQVLGCDLGYMGTRFIATTESAAGPQYKQAVVDASMDDIELTSLLTGIPTSMIRAGTEAMPTPGRPPGPYDAKILRPNGEAATRFSAGHSVSGIAGIEDVASLVARTEAEYRAARERGATATL